MYAKTIQNGECTGEIRTRRATDPSLLRETLSIDWHGEDQSNVSDVTFALETLTMRISPPLPGPTYGGVGRGKRGWMKNRLLDTPPCICRGPSPLSSRLILPQPSRSLRTHNYCKSPGGVHRKACHGGKRCGVPQAVAIATRVWCAGKSRNSSGRQVKVANEFRGGVGLQHRDLNLIRGDTSIARRRPDPPHNEGKGASSV